MAHKVHYVLNSTHSGTKVFVELQMCWTLSLRLLLCFIIGLICHIGKVTVPPPPPSLLLIQKIATVKSENYGK